MIKARAGDLLMFGLTEDNVRRLRLGEPIYADLATLMLPGKVVIFWGDTNDSIKAELEKLIGPDTIVTDHTKRGTAQ